MAIFAPLSRLRFTLLFLGTMLLANHFAGSLGAALPAHVLAAWGIGHNALLDGAVFRVFTGIFLSHDPQMLLRQVLFAALILGYTEWRRGTLPTLLVFFGLSVTTTLILMACINLGAGIVDLTDQTDVGMSLGGFGLIGLALTDWPEKWTTLSVVLGTIVAKTMMAPDFLADGGHLLALCLGFALGLWRPIGKPKRQSHAH